MTDLNSLLIFAQVVEANSFVPDVAGLELFRAKHPDRLEKAVILAEPESLYWRLLLLVSGLTRCLRTQNTER